MINPDKMNQVELMWNKFGAGIWEALAKRYAEVNMAEVRRSSSGCCCCCCWCGYVAVVAVVVVAAIVVFVSWFVVLSSALSLLSCYDDGTSCASL